MDHTFSGIMFDVQVLAPPIEELLVSSIWVRGNLGSMKIYFAEGGHADKFSDQNKWTLVHQGNYSPSMFDLTEMSVDPPVRLLPGQLYCFYVHSGLLGDRGIVYNNRRSMYTHTDRHLRILPGLAHIDNRPFNGEGPWGFGAWRAGREFVGRINYSCRWLLWNPNVHHRFPPAFRRMVHTLALCHRRAESPLSVLPDEIILHILNMCGWDWAGFSPVPQHKNRGTSVGGILAHSAAKVAPRDEPEGVEEAAQATGSSRLLLLCLKWFRELTVVLVGVVLVTAPHSTGGQVVLGACICGLFASCLQQR